MYALFLHIMHSCCMFSSTFCLDCYEIIPFSSTRELEVGSVDPSVVIDATADNTNYKTLEVHEAGLLKDDKHLESACDQSKSIEEGSGIKQEPLKLDASETLGTAAAAEDLKISLPDDLSQTHPEVKNRWEVPACTVDKQSPKESTEIKILTEKMDSSDEQAELVAKSLVPEAGNLKVNTTTVSIDQKEKFESVEKEESGVKTDEEDEKTGSCSDAPVMVEAWKSRLIIYYQVLLVQRLNIQSPR
ncbi:hypothetical protein HanPI659440_Chr16g0622531 [Helianthus annuus]|nr:hypothetical protein HanPI659440_Chr16g0622531 [Helianthus annuus]